MGLSIDSAAFIVKVTERRIEKARALMLGVNEQVKRTGRVDAQILQSLVGQLVAMTLAIPAAPAFTRGLYDTIVSAGREGTDEAKLTAEASEELDFWPRHLERLNGAPIRNRAETAVICVDASEQGMGATCGDMRLAEPLPAELVGKSSTLRELYGVLRAVQVWGKEMKGQHVRIVMDSLPARNLIKGGGHYRVVTTGEDGAFDSAQSTVQQSERRDPSSPCSGKESVHRPPVLAGTNLVASSKKGTID